MPAFVLIKIAKYNFYVIRFHFNHNLKIKLYMKCSEVVFWQIFKRVLKEIFISAFSFSVVVLVVQIIIKNSIILQSIIIIKNNTDF